MPSLIEQSGGQPQKQARYVPVFTDRCFTGLYTQRAALHDPADVPTARYYGGRPDALWAGKNIELTNRLTLQRRPGSTSFSTATYPTPPTSAFSFQLSDSTIRVIVDTQSTGSLALSAVGNTSGGTTVYTGVFPNGGSNAYVGMEFLIAGFANGANNGSFTVTASTTTTLTLSNTAGVAETHAATAVSAGAVYWDEQNGSKVLLFAKSTGAGQTLFQAVAGILYAGDGVDTWKYTPLNPNLPPGSAVSVWNWGIVAPTTQPSVAITATGAASTIWQANTIFSTMGLTVDSFNQAWQLIGVNADGSNTAGAVFGTAGNGQPAWNQSLFGTTTEGSGTPIVWKNVGQLLPWQASFSYGVSHLAGVAGLTAIYDQASDSVYCNFTGHGGLTVSGTTKPPFNGVAGGVFHDNQCVWFFVGTSSQMQAWQPSTAYNNWVGTGTTSTGFAGIPTNCAIEPFILPPPPTQAVYLQVPTNTGTSGTATSPFLVDSGAGTQQPDGQLLWLSLGSAVWAANTNYIQWQAQGTPFGCVTDGVNMQVCTTSGVTDPTKPGTVNSSLTAVANASSGTTAYTGTFSPTLTPGRSVVISGFTHAANNGTFSVVTCSATTLVVNNAGGVAESDAGSLICNPWGVAYGATTQDGSVTWVCVGPQVTWVAGSATTGIWNLPLSGFQPPQASQAFGGSEVNSSTALVETTVSSGESGFAQPTWSALAGYTADTAGGGSSFALTSVAVSGGVATYTGTITGGGSNAFVGLAFVVTGFTNAANNGIIYVTASTATTLVCNATGQVAETHGAAATRNLTWFAESVVTSNSLSWSSGLAYAYSFKARAFDDFYSPLPLGGGDIPPGSTFGALGSPTGSATNAVSTASPAFTIVGANAGAVNTVSGLGSIDPQVDTIIIWRSADSAAGSSQMFELTEIPAPKPVGGVAQPWSFQDFLPSTPTALYPGLNINIPAPIDDVNDPPFPGFLPMAYNFQRIWGGLGQSVAFSGGPDTLVGTPNEAFAPADNLPFLAPVIRLVKTPQGLVTFLPDSVEVIGGGPQTASFFSVTWAPGIGLMNYNALDVLAGEIYFFSSDNQFRIMTPSLNVSNAGFPLGDQFANTPSSGASDTTWNANNVYVASHQNGTDNCIFVADGSTGWYRLNPHQAGVWQGTPEPVWSPFAAITDGCTMVQSVQTSPGIKKLLIGGATEGQEILQRDLTVFTDNGTAYDAFFVMGSIALCHPGQLAVLKFLEFDFSGVSFQPTVSYLLNEIAGTFVPFIAAPIPDPPSLYGTTTAPTSYSPARYYFLGNASLARCRHLQVKVDFGTNSTGSELFDMTILGRVMIES